MDKAKAFLARAVPWPTAHDDWWINIHHTFTMRNGRMAVPGRAFKSLEKAAAHIEWLTQQTDKSDIYVCMSAQSQAKSDVNKFKRPIHRAIRASANAVQLRSIWLDVDVKAGAYVSTGDALAAFGTFRQAAALPMPTFIVLSGSGGFHVHWVLEDPVDCPTWASLSGGLASATKALGFQCDTSVTIDAARLLRVPDTKNWKTDPPGQVSLVYNGNLVSTERLRQALANYHGTVNAHSPGSRPIPNHGRLGPPSPIFAQSRVNADALDAGITIPLPTIEAVAHACPWIADVLATAGATQLEPLWRESLKISFYCTDGKEVAHELSSGHPGYSEQDTDDKFDRVAQDQLTGKYGWPQCNTIHNAGARQCSSCKHLGAGKSPLNFTALVTAAPPSTPPPPPPPTWPPGITAAGNPQPPSNPLPPGYVYGHNHFIFTELQDPADPNKLVRGPQVCPVPMWDFWLQQKKNGIGRYALGFKAQINKTLVEDVQVTYGDLSDFRRLAGTLSDQGITLKDKYLKPFRDLMTSFTEQLHEKLRDAVEAETYGWSVDTTTGKEAAFVYGKTRWNCNGNTPVSLADAELAKAYNPVGTLQAWQEAAKLVTEQGRPELDAIIASSFGGPLVALTGHSGFVLSIFSPDSGSQKSTAMRCGQAVWGHPVSGMGAWDDTVNFVNNRLGMIRHMPFFYDELKLEEQTQRFVGLIFGMGQGKTKGRLSRSAASQPINTFATMLVAASNNSLVDYISEHTKLTTAGVYRVFELRTGPNRTGKGMIDGTKAQIVSGALASNYGHPGLVYAQFLGQNVDLVRKEVEETGLLLGKLLGGKPDERFWLSTVTVILMGAKYANQLGLTNFDIAALTNFMVAEFKRHRGERNVSTTDITKVSNITDYISDYVNSKRQQTIITDKIWTAPARPPANYAVNLLTNAQHLQGRLAVHAAKDDMLLRISLSDFRSWLKEKKGVPRKVILDQIKMMMPSRMVTSHLGLHTNYKNSVEPLIEFDLKKMPDFFDFG